MASGASGDGHGCYLRSLTAPGFHYDHMSPYSEKLFSQLRGAGLLPGARQQVAGKVGELCARA
jgi:hypothetical protein